MRSDRRGAGGDMWTEYTMCSISGATVTALPVSGAGDLWPTARFVAMRDPLRFLESDCMPALVRQLCLRRARQVCASLYFRCQDFPLVKPAAGQTTRVPLSTWIPPTNGDSLLFWGSKSTLHVRVRCIPCNVLAPAAHGPMVPAYTCPHAPVLPVYACCRYSESKVGEMRFNFYHDFVPEQVGG